MSSFEQSVTRCMTEAFLTIEQGATLRDAAEALANHDIGMLLVNRGTQLVGVVSERDLVRALADGDDPDVVRLADRATADIVTIDAAASVQDAIALMVGRGIRHLVVATDGRPAGVLSARDVLSELAVI